MVAHFQTPSLVFSSPGDDILFDMIRVVPYVVARFNNVTNSVKAAPGGEFTLGGTKLVIRLAF